MKQAKIILLLLLIILVFVFGFWLYTDLSRQKKDDATALTEYNLQLERQSADRLLQRLENLQVLANELAPPPIDLNLTL
jgi:Tfp pilus assembly protein PilO